MERKEILAGINPQTLWYNRLNKVLFCWLWHKYRVIGRRPTPYSYLIAVDKQCVRCGESFTDHVPAD